MPICRCCWCGRPIRLVVRPSQHLKQAGFDVSRLGIPDPQTLISGLGDLQPDVVFNLFEGAGDRGHTETYVVGLLEWLGVPLEILQPDSR